MGTYGNFNGVLREWKLGNLTEAQAIGQILQLLEELEKRVTELEKIINPAPAKTALNNGGQEKPISS